MDIAQFNSEPATCAFAMFPIEMYRKKVKNCVFHENEQFNQPSLYPNAFNQLPMLD